MGKRTNKPKATTTINDNHEDDDENNMHTNTRKQVIKHVDTRVNPAHSSFLTIFEISTTSLMLLEFMYYFRVFVYHLVYNFECVVSGETECFGILFV